MPNIAQRVIAEQALLVDSPLPSLLPNSDAAGTSVPFTAASGITVTRLAQVDRDAESLEPAFALAYTSSADLFAGVTFTIPYDASVGRYYPAVEYNVADSLAGQANKLTVRAVFEYLNASGDVLRSFRTYSRSEASTAPSGAQQDARASSNGRAADGDAPFKFLLGRLDGRDLSGKPPAGTTDVRITLALYSDELSGSTYVPTKLTRTVYLTRLRAVWQVSTGDGPYFPVGYLSGNFQEIGGSAITYRYVRGGDVSGVVDEIDAGTMTLTLFDALVGVADPRLRPGRRVTLAARNAGVADAQLPAYGNRYRTTWSKLWTGTITDVQASFEAYKGTEHPRRPRITITATDAKTALEGVSAPYGFLGPELKIKAARIFYRARTDAGGVGGIQLVTDTRTAAEAAETGWTDRNNINVVLPSASLWQQLELARNSYPNAKLWATSDGNVALQTLLPPTTPTYTMTDGSVAGVPKPVPYTDLGLQYGARVLVNSLTVKRTNASEAEGEKVYGPFVAPRSVSEWGTVSAELETTDGDPTTLARNYLAIYATPRTFPRTVTFSGYSAESIAAQAPWAELYSSVRVINAAAGVDVAAWVVGIEAAVTRERWTITWTLRPMEPAAIAATNQSGVGQGPTDVVAVNTGSASELAGSINLDTLTTPGTRAQTSNVEAASGANYPVPQAGLLEVNTNNDLTMVWQRFTVYAGGDYAGAVYVRALYSGTWTPWTRIAETGAREILQDVNLNTLTDGATYTQTVVSRATTALNYPVQGSSGTGVLEVEPAPGAGLIWQRYTTVQRRVFVRVCSSGTWSAWAELGAGSPAASAVTFSPSGSLSSTNVQAALAELDGDMTVPQPYASRYKSTDQSVPTATWTDIPMQSELFAAQGGITYSAPSLTMPKAGRYLVAASVRWAGNATGSRGCGLAVNGTLVARTSVPGSNTENTTVACSRIMRLAAGDAVKVQGYQSSGGSIVARLAENSTALEVTWLGP